MRRRILKIRLIAISLISSLALFILILSLYYLNGFSFSEFIGLLGIALPSAALTFNIGLIFWQDFRYGEEGARLLPQQAIGWLSASIITGMFPLALILITALYGFISTETLFIFFSLLEAMCCIFNINFFYRFAMRTSS